MVLLFGVLDETRGSARRIQQPSVLRTISGLVFYFFLSLVRMAVLLFSIGSFLAVDVCLRKILGE